MANQITMTPEMTELAEQWIEAKQNEKGWADHRKSIEEKLTELNDGYEELLGLIENKPVLTVSADLGDKMKVNSGYTMKTAQADIISFLSNNPAMINILFKQEYKAVASAVLKAIEAKGPIAEQLETIVSYDPKRPSYSLK